MNDRDQTNRDRRARDIFLRAVEIELAEARSAYIDGACKEDASLRSRVEALLESHRQDAFLETPAVHGSPVVAAETALSEAPGSVIGRYKLLEKIGEGGFGAVYMAEQKEPVKRRVALKVIKLGMDTRQVVARFEAERQALALMDHPHIAKVLDAGATDTGRPFFVMELVRGVPITRFCEERRLTIRQRLELFVPVCQAIQHAHQKGVIHRDVKPTNVLVTLNDGVPHPMVIDFGVAKAIDQQLTDKTLYTRFAQMIGTPAYMSPEQAEMSKQDVDTRTDVYSLGVLLYELLTGETPFPEERLREAGYAEIQRIICEEEPEKPSTRLTKSLLAADASRTPPQSQIKNQKSKIENDLDWIVLKAIDKDRTRRYETANGLAMDIRRHLDNEPVVARPPSKLYELQKTFRRHKVGFAATAGIILVLAIGIVVSTWQSIRATRAHQDAVDALGKARRSEQRAKDESVVAERNLYESDILLAQQALQVNDTGHARELLKRHNPIGNPAESNATREGSEEDLRGWEWRYLWGQLQSGKPEVFATLDGSSVVGLELSPNGRYLAASTMNGVLKLWELSSTQEWTIQKEVGLPTRAAFFPDSSRLVYNYLTGQSTNGLLKIWDLRTHQVTNEIRYPNRIGSKLVGPNGHLILFSIFGGGPDGRATIKLFDLRTEQFSPWTIHVRGGFHNSDSLVFADPMGQECVLGDNPGEIRVFNVESGKDITKWKAESAGLTALKMSHDGRLLASASGSTIKIWDYRDCRAHEPPHQPIGELKGHTALVFDVEFTSDDSRLVSSSGDKTVRLWDLKTFTELYTYRGADQEVWEVELSPDDRTIYAGAKNGSIYVWDATVLHHKVSPVVARDVDRFALSQSGNRLAVLSTDGSVKTAVIGDEIALAPADYAGTDNSFVSLSSDGNQLIAGKTNGGIAVYSVATGELLHSNHVHHAAITCVRMLASGSRLLSSDGERNLVLQEIHGGEAEELWRMRPENWDPGGNVEVPAVSPDERTVALGDYFGRVTLWNLANGHEICSFTNPSPQRYINALAFSPDGQTLASADAYGAVRLWDTATRQQVPPHLLGHRGFLALAFSPDGKRLISGGHDVDGVIVWDVLGRKELLRLRQAGGARQLAFSPDGNRLFALISRTLYVWRAPP